MSTAERLGALAVAAMLACAVLFAVLWVAADFAALRAEQILAHPDTGTDRSAREARARAELQRALELRAGHPSYLIRLWDLELGTGARLRAAGDMDAARPVLEHAEALAKEAFEVQPFPYHLVRAAAARAERALIDAEFERLLRDAGALGPRDQDVTNGVLLLSLYNWRLIGVDQRRRTVDLLLDSRSTASRTRAALAAVDRYRGWPLLCADDRVRSAFADRCSRLAPAS